MASQHGPRSRAPRSTASSAAESPRGATPPFVCVLPANHQLTIEIMDPWFQHRATIKAHSSVAHCVTEL